LLKQKNSYKSNAIPVKQTASNHLGHFITQ